MQHELVRVSLTLPIQPMWDVSPKPCTDQPGVKFNTEICLAWSSAMCDRRHFVSWTVGEAQLSYTQWKFKQFNPGNRRESRIEMNGSVLMVTHPGTNLAQPGLTAVFLEGQVLSTGPQVPSNYHNNSRENNALNRLVFFDLSNQCVYCVAEWCKALAVDGLGAG